MTIFYKLVARQVPDLKLKLAQARISQTPEYYVQRTVFVSMLLAVSVTLIAFMFSKSWKVILLFPIIYGLSFFYFINYANAKIMRIRRDISKEIVFAGRFLIIELDSGVPMYRAFQNMGRNYETIGRYFDEIVQRVDLGTPMEEALNEAVQLSPSNDLRRIFWQILNSLKTGSEVTSALNNVVEQIVREQQIEVKEYGRKLNPLAMFYMMIAVIIPSLGTIMIVVLATFLNLNLDMILFLLIIGVNVIIQLIFLSMIKAQRPAVDI